MPNNDKATEKLLAALRERAKELNCLYEVEKRLNLTGRPLAAVFREVAGVIGSGWQYPELCEVQIRHDDSKYESSEFEPTPWFLTVDIKVHGEVAGSLSVYYTKEMPAADEGPFLAEEIQLIHSLADRLSRYLAVQCATTNGQKQPDSGGAGTNTEYRKWKVVVDLLLETDKNLFLRISRKMLNLLCSIGVADAQQMLQELDAAEDPLESIAADANVPERRRVPNHSILLSKKPFEVAADCLSDDEILKNIQKWINDDKVSFLIKVLDNPCTTLPEVVKAVRHYTQTVAVRESLSLSTLKSVRVSLARRFLNDQSEFIKTAKQHVRLADFDDVLDRIIMPADSHGKLGGKSSGLLLARSILNQADKTDHPIGEVKIPKTWYIASDGIQEFIGFNDLEDVLEQKYKEIDEIRREYPNIIQLFKNSPFPPELVRGLAAALDELGDAPIIVRSSSLLEDRLETTFSGKYKSLFLANQGPKQTRLQALTDAVAEVYASTFGPDPIEYRHDHGLLEFNEQMGILIQEVVGKRIGKYYWPAFAGVAFSRNEFRWSARIDREDGLVRLVPGLGTRAVDRTSDDYPVLVVPGKPNLRINVAIDEIVRYSPKKIDVINLEANTFETVSLNDLLALCGDEYPALSQIFSILSGETLKKPVGLLLDPARDQLVPTFEGLRSESPFLAQLGNILHLLEEHLHTPIDIEFAHDGNDFYLLQCRAQSHEEDVAPAPIPGDIPEQDILFSADRYVSNGWVPEITHLVYIDPERYSKLETRGELLTVGRVVGQLNKLLPKKQFILMGPGRWGSRGDITLGVNVTYADISNTAMLIEIARQKGSYLPEVSFGTHFFQDLVESRIRYLPLYPDEIDSGLNERFLFGAPNLLGDLLPDDVHLSETIRVIDIPAMAEGRVLKVLLNADLDRGVGLLIQPGEYDTHFPNFERAAIYQPTQYWRWRLQMAERIAAEIAADQLGVVALYLFGSVKNATAGPGSDIDLLVHFRGDEAQRRELHNWLDGWSLCLAEINHMRTGYRMDRLLDAHLITDQDIANGTSYAVKIGAVTDAARELALGNRSPR